MAVRDTEAFLRQRAAIFDPNMDVDPGSPFDVQVIQPMVRRAGTDPFTVDLTTFINDRIAQAFPELATKEGDALADLLNKPVSLLWDPIVREIKRVRLGLSFRDTSVLTVEEAEALGANLFAERRSGQFAKGPGRIFFAAAQNSHISPINFCTSRNGLRFFPTEIQSIRTEEMLQNVASDGLYYFDINLIAERAGDQYNIEVNSLASIANVPSAVRVTNTRRFGFGEDEDTAQEFADRVKGELTERSLVTLRGISSQVTKSFPEVRRLNVVGFNDPEMQRDVIKGGGLGPVIASGIGGFVDDDGAGQPLSRRFSTNEVDFTSILGPTTVTPGPFVLTVYEAFGGTPLVDDLDVLRVVSSSSIEVSSQILAPGSGGVPARGRYNTVPKASLVDGETFVLDDGINPPTTFEFDLVPNGVTPGNVVVDVSAATSADNIRDAMIAAINGVGAGLLVTASSGGPARVNAVNDQTGVVGNVALGETVTNVGFTAEGMSGGVGGISLRWSIRKKTLTLSDIPGGILFPDGPSGTITVPDDEIHIGGATDVHVRATGFDAVTIVLDDVADDVPESSGTLLTTEISGSDTVFRLSDFMLDVDYTSADELFQLLQRASAEGMSLQVQEAPNAGVFRIVSVTQVTTDNPIILTDPQPTVVSAVTSRWKISDEINIDLVDPKETKVSGTDMNTVQNSDLVSTVGATDFDMLGVAKDDVLRITEGPDAGDSVILQDPSATGNTTLQIDKLLTSTGSGLNYTIFRPNVDGGLLLPFIRLTGVELLDSSKQPLGSTIPYAKPIDIQSRAFQNPSRGIKHTFRDVTLGVVGASAGVAATGTITTVPRALLLDGETFTIDDGINPAITFEFDVTGTNVPVPGNVEIDLFTLGAISANDVRDEIINAVNNVGSALFVTASSGGASTVALTNDQLGVVGNEALAETVVNVGFVVAGMLGGLDDTYNLGAADTLGLIYYGLAGAGFTVVAITFSAGPLTRTQVIDEISSAVAATLSIPSAAVSVGTDRFGLKPLRRGVVVVSGTAVPVLFGNNEIQTSWDVRSETVDGLGGWDSLSPPIDLLSGLDVIQIISGNQVGFQAGPFFVDTPGGALDTSTALMIISPDILAFFLLTVDTPRFAPEIGVDVQVGVRSIGSARCYFLDPTSTEFDQDSRFSVETDVGTLRFLPDPTLATVRIPPPPGGTTPKDGSATGAALTFTSASQDFIRSGIRAGDELVINYIPLLGTALMADPVIGLAGKTFVYSYNDGPNRILTFINDDTSIPTTDVTRDGVVDQINASIGEDVAELSGTSLKLVAEVSLVVRSVGTSNAAVLNKRFGLPSDPQYDFSSSDQDNQSPHAGTFQIAAVPTAATLTILSTTGFPPSGDFSDPIIEQQFTIQRPGAQRISTTQMAANGAEARLFYFDVELVSEGTGDLYNIDADEQLFATDYRSDGWYLTTDDEDLTFSSVELPKMVISKSILENGVDDDPANATNLIGQNIQLSYDRSQLVDDVNSFISSEIDRVVCESPLARHLLPHFIRYDFTYQGGSAEDIIKADHERHIRDLFPSDPLESSDLQKLASDRGVTSITNPINIIAVVHNVDRTIQASRFQNALTTGRLAAFIPDVLNIVRNVS